MTENASTHPKSLPFKDTLLIFMILCFISISITGILKLRSFTSFFNIDSSSLPYGQITILHDWSGVVLITLIVTHLIIQNRWFRYMGAEIKKLFKNNAILVVLSLLIPILAVLAVYYVQKNPKSSSDTIRQLAEVQVDNYEGEDLSSIEDFRENSIKGPQYLDIEDYTLTIDGLVDNPLELTYDEVLAFDSYQKVVTLHCVEGWSATILWEGILIEDMLHDAGISESANTVIFRAYDGYSTSLSLDFINDNNILLAYKMNNVVLPPERGYPFQVVAEDKWGYKWAKWITEIEISSDEDFEGYWEKAGYNNNGDVNGPKFE